ncbi:hypothetical protein OG884_25820 [Streptosporangium sp. NBC_01755]|uniref:hypothetical protein n=1 Tax=Streptosporangium sp. NBC_01755 TaxID=2975949 RepID=UPI002DDB0119|nr:hypothetical protein [Streptosporangium sp. NBC_01755]WSC98275.1 hypothetical protein OG884_25820 [Streptosporangium sp. NBC_01755]
MRFPEAPRLRDAMRDARDFYFDSISQVHMDRWPQGRSVLLRDAASEEGEYRGTTAAYSSFPAQPWRD